MPTATFRVHPTRSTARPTTSGRPKHQARSPLRSRSRWELEKDFGELLALAPRRSTRAITWHDPSRLSQQIDRIARHIESQPRLLHRVEQFLDAWRAADPVDRRWSLVAAGVAARRRARRGNRLQLAAS
ncbi:hypothetical protein DFR29_103337 [Tahibacter aquaticus]|uniref:Uncharacterized protein n=1 Tax=Tahibacter aquaticus TaxID=520092 RepID=A0A4R6Z556_9GAMM|nr:hypothetical protein [Tahibacter aquaticus]TDR46801.1 hypothetical protein DFR29_103337 [Tahibacter aquaticus]